MIRITADPLNVSEKLDVEIAGSGECQYTGTPQQKINISGSGTVIHED